MIRICLVTLTQTTILEQPTDVNPDFNCLYHYGICYIRTKRYSSTEYKDKRPRVITFYYTPIDNPYFPFDGCNEVPNAHTKAIISSTHLWWRTAI